MPLIGRSIIIGFIAGIIHIVFEPKPSQAELDKEEWLMPPGTMRHRIK